MIARQMGSPSPAPPVFVEKLGSKIRLRFSGEIPTPVSRMVTSAAPFSPLGRDVQIAASASPGWSSR